MRSLLVMTIAAGVVSSAMAQDAPFRGSCTLVQKNQFAGPFNVCVEPLSESQCGSLGKQDENSGAVHATKPCPSEKVIGVCDRGANRVIYYSGEPMNLEIGCGFQSGEWKAAGE